MYAGGEEGHEVCKECVRLFPNLFPLGGLGWAGRGEGMQMKGALNGSNVGLIERMQDRRHQQILSRLLPRALGVLGA